MSDREVTCSVKFRWAGSRDWLSAEEKQQHAMSLARMAMAKVCEALRMQPLHIESIAQSMAAEFRAAVHNDLARRLIALEARLGDPGATTTPAGLVLPPGTAQPEAAGPRLVV